MVSHSLQQLQQSFAQGIHSGKTNNTELFQAKSGFTPSQLINVYHNNYFYSLSDALRATYSAVERLVGESFFNFIAKEYIQEHPPNEACLTHFGDQFSTFIKNHPQCQTLSYLSEVAKLERYYELAYHAKEIPPYDTAKLQQFAQTDYEKLNIQLHPSVQVFYSDYPTIELWLMNENTKTINLENNPTNILVYRYNYQVLVKSINDYELDFINNCKQQNLGQLVKKLPDSVNLQTMLQNYIEQQIIVNFSVYN